MLLLRLLTITLLLIIFAEDMYHRAVHWFLFPMLAIAFILIRLRSHEPLPFILMDSTLNLGFVLLQFILVTLYFSLKHKRFINITSGQLGWGDVLFILSFAFLLSPVNYVAFYISSLLMILMGWLIYNALICSTDRQIPLAGLQAFLLAGVIGTSWWTNSFKLTQDTWLFHYLYR